MAKGPKRKAGKATRVGYRTVRKLRNKERRIAREDLRQEFFQLRNKLMVEQKMTKGNARREVRRLQEAGEVEVTLSP